MLFINNFGQKCVNPYIFEQKFLKKSILVQFYNDLFLIKIQ